MHYLFKILFHNYWPIDGNKISGDLIGQACLVSGVEPLREDFGRITILLNEKNRRQKRRRQRRHRHHWNETKRKSLEYRAKRLSKNAGLSDVSSSLDPERLSAHAPAPLPHQRAFPKGGWRMNTQQLWVLCGKRRSSPRVLTLHCPFLVYWREPYL